MGEYVTLPEPPELGYGPVKVYRMTKEGKKLPPDVHPERMKRGVHYRLQILSTDTLYKIARERGQRLLKQETGEMQPPDANGHRRPKRQESE